MRGASDLRSPVTAAQVALLAIRRPRVAWTMFRSVGGRALDAAFDLRAELPSLPAAYLQTSSEFVRLPPPQLLEPGNQSHAGLVHLVALARLVDARRIFEFGTYNGLTALTLALNLAEARIDTLDLPPGLDPALPIFSDDPGNIADRSRRAYDGTEAEARITQHFADSAHFDFDTLTEPFELVYVDGAHSYEYVRNDTNAAFQIVADDGIVVWDDYWRGVPDVPRFLHRIPDRTIYRIPGTRLAVWMSESVHRRANSAS